MFEIGDAGLGPVGGVLLDRFDTPDELPPLPGLCDAGLDPVDGIPYNEFGAPDVLPMLFGIGGAGLDPVGGLTLDGFDTPGALPPTFGLDRDETGFAPVEGAGPGIFPAFVDPCNASGAALEFAGDALVNRLEAPSTLYPCGTGDIELELVGIAPLDEPLSRTGLFMTDVVGPDTP